MLLSLDDTTDGDERLQSVCEHTGSHSVRENDSGFQPRPDPFRSDMVNSRVLSLESHLLMRCALLVPQSQEACLPWAWSSLKTVVQADSRGPKSRRAPRTALPARAEKRTSHSEKSESRTAGSNSL